MDRTSAGANIFRGRLREARDLRNLSQSDLANRANLQPSAISHFESGQRFPSFDNLRKLADALEVSTDYLLGRSETADGTGQVMQRLNRHAEKMTSEDLEALEVMAKALANKNKRRGESKDG